MDKFEDKTLLEALRQYAGEDVAPFHMPGHKRNAAFGHLAGLQEIDVTEIDGFDDLHCARGVLKRANDLAAETYRVRASRMLVGGSTAGILAAIRALTRRGDKILIARNCHGSVFNAAELCELDASYVLPEWTRAGFYGSLTPDAVREALCENAGTKLVVVTSPTYEGVISDIAGIAEVCRSFGARLVVDEAHGAHLGFSTFERSARKLGADIVVNSLHKTLPSLTQTALIHVCADDIPIELVDEQLATFETSSPSYPFMASIEGCVRYLREGKALEEWARGIVKLREELKSLRGFELYGGEDVYKLDVSKLTFVSHCEASGVELMRALRQRGVELEMAGVNYAVAMCGAGDSPQMYSRLKAALFELCEGGVFQKSILNKALFESSFPKNAENGNTYADPSGKKEGKNSVFHTLRDIGEGALDERGALRRPALPTKAMSSFEARELAYELVPLSDAEGRICAENIKAYPPGCPMLVKGERIDGSTLSALIRLFECGVSVSGGRGSFPQNIAVVA